jgi:hypothetical protein
MRCGQKGPSGKAAGSRGSRDVRLRVRSAHQSGSPSTPTDSLPRATLHAAALMASKGRLILCTVPGSTPNRFAILRTPSVRPGAFRAVRICASSSGAIRGRPSCLPSALARRPYAQSALKARLKCRRGAKRLGKTRGIRKFTLPSMPARILGGVLRTMPVERPRPTGRSREPERHSQHAQTFTKKPTPKPNFAIEVGSDHGRESLALSFGSIGTLDPRLMQTTTRPNWPAALSGQRVTGRGFPPQVDHSH